MRIAFVHAHPDDESLWSGALTLHLVAAGHDVWLLTATRGERGEVVPGPLSELAGTPELERRRGLELAGAVASLGFAGHAFLGDAPVGSGRRYKDSGMTWIRPGLAGPADDAEPDSLCQSDFGEVVADLTAWLRSVGAELVISYDDDGGYGHPDHVRLHHAARDAAARLGLDFAAVVHAPAEDVQWFELEHLLPQVEQALAHHATQLTVNGDGTITHSGGQQEEIVTSVGLRPPQPGLQRVVRC
ncbi:MAG: PIG-L family deacetylase [Propionibacteriaceae bacterium]|nr:PIG-L family deacetylase [Propionibacteriaceae bacterium]